MYSQATVFLIIFLSLSVTIVGRNESDKAERMPRSEAPRRRVRQRKAPGESDLGGEEDDLPAITPLVIPRLSRTEKIALIRASGQDPFERRRRHPNRSRKGRRRGTRDVERDPVWHRLDPLTTAPPPGPAIALDIHKCPHSFDAVTRAHNGRTYVFSRERVHQIWRSDNLQQKAVFLISDMFPGGPRTVNTAYTNARSGVTILIEYRTVYRFRWNRNRKRFYLARKSPQPLSEKIPFLPRVGFQWKDGNQVLVEGDHFVTYDAYWNVPTFNSLVESYFPNLPRNLIGVVYSGDHLLILYTSANTIQIYDTQKYRVVQEYPIRINEYAGCLRKV